MLLPEAGPGNLCPPDRTSRPRPATAIPARAAHSFRALSSVSGPSCSWPGHAAWLRARTAIRSRTLERAAAKRMGATTYDIDSSHVPMLSHPDYVLDVIRTAAASI